MSRYELHLEPAYGRKYLSITDLRKDFYDGKDFKGTGHKDGRYYVDVYLSIRDIPEKSSVTCYWGKLGDRKTILEV